MATKELAVKVWIEPGCIVCDACETTCPEVFHVTDDTCIVRPEALNVEFTKPLTETIIEAAQECPVDVIKYELAPFEVDEAVPAPAKAPAVVAAKPKAVAEPSRAAPAKAPAAPPAKAPAEPAVAAVAKAPAKPPVTSVAGNPDPAIQALLRAATYRGGKAGIDKQEVAVAPSAPAVQDWKKKRPDELPPDARQAKLLEATRPAKPEDHPSRRDVLAGVAMGIGWFAFAATGALSAGPVFGRFMMPNVLEEPDPRVRVGKLDKYMEMSPGDVNEDYKPQGIWMIREEDKIAALSIICTHLGCIPNWLPNDRKFKCPCHGSGYKPNGINFEGPTPRPLERFKISVVDGIVLVDKSKKFQYEKGEWTNPDSFIPV
jgi:cytochrome b6-f complex iron-sulfur subunit